MNAVLIVGGLIALYYFASQNAKTNAAISADTAALQKIQGGAAATSTSGNGTLYSGSPSTLSAGAIAQNSAITGLEIGSGISVATTAAETAAKAATGAASSLSEAIPVVGAAIGAVAGILLAQHTARLQGATNENQALDQIIPAFDQDIQEIIAYYNAGTQTAAQCIAGLQQVDAQVLAYLKKQVGPPGTAWDGSGKCTKSCTAGCCVYYNNLHSAIYGPSGAPYNGSIAAANGAYGLIPALQNPSAIPSSSWSGHPQCYIPEVYPPNDTAYGNYSRAGYSITITPPSKVTPL